MPMDRRHLFRAVAALGIGTPAFHRAVAAEVLREEPKKEAEPIKAITAEMVQNAEWIAGLTLTDDERKAVAAGLTRLLGSVNTARKIPLANSVAT